MLSLPLAARGKKFQLAFAKLLLLEAKASAFPQRQGATTLGCRVLPQPKHGRDGCWGLLAQGWQYGDVSGVGHAPQGPGAVLAGGMAGWLQRGGWPAREGRVGVSTDGTKGQLDTVVGSASLDKQYLQAGMKLKREMHFQRYDAELMDSSLLSSLFSLIHAN